MRPLYLPAFVPPFNPHLFALILFDKWSKHSHNFNKMLTKLTKRLFLVPHVVDMRYTHARPYCVFRKLWDGCIMDKNKHSNDLFVFVFKVKHYNLIMQRCTIHWFWLIKGSVLLWIAIIQLICAGDWLSLNCCSLTSNCRSLYTHCRCHRGKQRWTGAVI